MRFAVTPYAGVWIEISILISTQDFPCVTPYAGVWIEITVLNLFISHLLSLPTRECGLKLEFSSRLPSLIPVTPYAGVWIEILATVTDVNWSEVSLPTRECGLKYSMLGMLEAVNDVTPYAGVWIEIQSH